METERPKVGIGVMIIKDGKILLHKRKNAHGAGAYACPGGHLEHAESIIDCAIRETKEEAAIEITNVRFLCLSNEKDHLPKHYVNIGIIADWKNGEPQIMEPEKCENWNWFTLDNLPEPLYPSVRLYVEAYKTGQTFFDA